MRFGGDYRVNRTGALNDVDSAAEAFRGVLRFSPSPSHDQTEIFRMRSTYIKQKGMVGSLPAAESEKQAILLNKLGARLNFERESTRLYQTLMQKHAALSSVFPNYYDLERIGNQEWDHFGMLQDTILGLGGDPTMLTPAASVVSQASSGIHKVIQDPRTSLGQCFEAILTAELLDNASWEMLITLTRELHQDHLVNRFHDALREEQDHLATVRDWVLQDMRNSLAA
jgi:hypothetical protein